MYQRHYYDKHRDYYAQWRDDHREMLNAKARERYHAARLITAGNNSQP